MEDIKAIGVIDLIEADHRPTFILDLNVSTCHHTDGISPLYANAAVRSLSLMPNFFFENGGLPKSYTKIKITLNLSIGP